MRKSILSRHYVCLIVLINLFVFSSCSKDDTYNDSVRKIPVNLTPKTEVLSYRTIDQMKTLSDIRTGLDSKYTYTPIDEKEIKVIPVKLDSEQLRYMLC